jgi:hypothetical protein
MDQQHMPGEEAWLIGEQRMERRNTIWPIYRQRQICAH